MDARMKEDRLVRLREIIGDSRCDPPVRGLLPMSRACFYQRVKQGKYPPPVKLGRISAWRLSSILEIIEAAEANRAA